MNNGKRKVLPTREYLIKQAKKPWNTRIFKCLIIGNPGTGKTALMKRLLGLGFNEDYQPTTEPVVHTFQFRTHRTRDRKRMRFHCYEYPMPEGFNDKFFKEKECIKMDCAIIMSDITDESSLNHVDDWIQLFKSHGKEIPIVICGNKHDLIPDDEIKPIRYQPKSDNVVWTPCSVKDLSCLSEPFCCIATRLGVGRTHDLPFCFVNEMTKRGVFPVFSS